MDFVIASRPDFLGSKLLTILNATRLAKLLGARLLYAWGGFRPHVLAPPDAYFEPEFAAPYQAETDRGFLVAQSFVDRLRTTERCRPVASNGREVTAVEVDPADLTAVDALICRERFALYLLPGEEVATVRASIAALAADLRFTPALRRAAGRLRAAIGPDATGVHIRRMDLLNFRTRRESMLSYVPDGYADAFIAARAVGETVVACSDDARVVDRMDRARPGVLRPAALIDDAALDPRQLACADLLALSCCARIHAGRSAFSLAAAHMGDGELIDLRGAATAADALPAPDALTASFFFFDRGLAAVAASKAEAAVDALALAVGFDARNLCLRFEHAHALGLAGDPHYAAVAAAALGDIMRRNGAWSKDVPDNLMLVRHAAAGAGDAARAEAIDSVLVAAAAMQHGWSYDPQALTVEAARLGPASCALSQALAGLLAWLRSCHHELQGDGARAVEALLEPALDRGQAGAFAFRLAWLASAQGRLHEAALHARTGLDANGENAGLELLLSHVEDRRHNFAVALAAARRALLLDPGDPELWHHAGNMCARNGRHADALLFYQGAIALDPQPGVYWARLCPVLAITGRMEALRAALARVVDADYREPGWADDCARHLGHDPPPDMLATLDRVRAREAQPR